MNLVFVGPQFDKVPVCSPCPLQIEALDNLASEVESFIDDLNTILVVAAWEGLMKSTAVSYTGEEVFPAEELHHTRLNDTFPAPKHGGAVPLVQVVDASRRHTLLHPELLIMPPEQWEPFPKVPPKVWADDKTWAEVVPLMLRSRIACAVPEGTQASARGRVVEHGSFAVGKPGNPRGTGPPRLVLNMPMLNIIMRVIQGDMKLLPLTNRWHMVFLEGDEVASCFRKT